MITLKQEIENLKYYVRILEMRHDIKFKAYFDIPEILESYKVPKLLLQPVVENSILHGFENLDREGMISVTAEMDFDKVTIFIYDNGKGMELESPEVEASYKELKFSGIGIANVDQRIKAHFGDQYGIHFRSVLGESTTAVITLPGLGEDDTDD